MKNEKQEVGQGKESFANGMNYYKLFWIFLIGCFAGVIIEIIWCLIFAGHFEYRTGLIYGPFNPVYGFGAVIMTLVLFKINNKRDLYTFLGAMILGAAFEFLCSFFQEISLGVVSWEYSDSPYNIGGRTNLQFALCWGLLGLVWVKDMYPRLSRLIERIPNKVGIPLTWILSVFMVLNMTISSLAVARQTNRRAGIEPRNELEVFLDIHYDDEFLKKIYQNMRFVR